MNFYVSSGLYSFFANIVIGTFVYSRNPKKLVNILFGLFSLCVSGWSVGSFFENVIPNRNLAIFILRLNYLFGVWLPAVYVHFVYTFIDLRSKFSRLKLTIFYSASVILSTFVFSPWFIKDLKLIKGTNFLISDPGILYYFFFIFFAIGMSEVLASTLFRIRQYTGRKRTQIKYITIANAIAVFAGFEYFTRVFGFFNSPPLDDYILVVYLLVLAYAIVRHQLMDIEVIIRRTILFAGLVAFVFGIFTSVTFLVQEFLNTYIHAGRFTINLISVILIVLGYDPLRKFLMDVTDKFLFQKKFDYQKLLKDASQGMSKIKSLDHLCQLVTHFITMRVRIKNAGVVARDIGTDTFYFNYGRGYEAPPLLKALHVSDPLIRFLQDENDAIDIEKVKEWIESKETDGTEKEKKLKRKYDFKVIKNHMDIMRAAACIPSFLGKELRNIIVLGEKKSGDFFTEEDLNVLYTLAQESAIAIENARLYDEAIHKQKELSGINRQLEIAQSNLITALNETELANKRLQDTQAQLIHEQKMATLGRLASSVGHEVNNPLTILSMNVSRAILKYRKNPNLKVNEILDVFQKMEQNIGRIKAVVNTLTGLLKKSEKGKFEPLSLKLVLEETLPLVQFQTYLDNLSGTEVEFDIPGNTPLIRGDLERLQEVFLNLFINAYHAMAGKRERKIYVTAKPGDENNSKMVIVEFTDNGAGMPEDVIKKIFQYGFTTKPVGKGSGMGLYMCRYIIELHGGDVKVRSTPGVGTTFVISLPVYEEESTIRSESEAKSNK